MAVTQNFLSELPGLNGSPGGTLQSQDLSSGQDFRTKALSVLGRSPSGGMAAPMSDAAFQKWFDSTFASGLDKFNPFSTLSGPGAGTIAKGLGLQGLSKLGGPIGTNLSALIGSWTSPAGTSGSSGGNIAHEGMKFISNVGKDLSSGADPVTMAVKVGIDFIGGVVNVFRENHFGNDSSVSAIDFYNVGAQYTSNPGRTNLDQSYGQMSKMFNGALAACGIRPEEMEADSKSFSAEQRMAIRTAIAQRTGVSDFAICFTDMDQVAKDEIKNSPPGQKQAAFDAYASQMQSLRDQITGNPFEKYKTAKGGIKANEGLMKTENASTSQYNYGQAALADLATATGVQFNARFDGADPRLKKSA